MIIELLQGDITKIEVDVMVNAANPYNLVVLGQKNSSRRKNISKERIKRWEKECFLPYDELSEKMKELDRKVARKILNITNEPN